jgi:uncharacterized membrane protein
MTPIRGPIPPPALFRQFEEILPGSADRILRMAEKEQDHRIDWEQSALRIDARNSFLGLRLGFGALLILVGGSLGAAWLGYPIVADIRL